MNKFASLFLACAAATGLALPIPALAAENTAAACSVSVDYVVNGTLADQYQKDFLVEQGTTFVDDQSTRLRAKTFTATVAKDAGKVVVSVDYFNDVGVFLAIGFNTRLTIRGGGGFETTSGSHGTYISTGVTPQVVGGNHETHYTLMCRRA